jgi:hypothetical protein
VTVPTLTARSVETHRYIISLRLVHPLASRSRWVGPSFAMAVVYPSRSSRRDSAIGSAAVRAARMPRVRWRTAWGMPTMAVVRDPEECQSGAPVTDVWSGSPYSPGSAVAAQGGDGQRLAAVKDSAKPVKVFYAVGDWRAWANHREA